MNGLNHHPGSPSERAALLAHRLSRTLVAALTALLLLLSGTATATAAGAATSAARRAGQATAIPPGTVLRVGEQLKNLSLVLSLGHQDQGFPYQVQYSEFVGGPAMLQAFEGGSLDAGFIQSSTYDVEEVALLELCRGDIDGDTHR